MHRPWFRPSLTLRVALVASFLTDASSAVSGSHVRPRPLAVSQLPGKEADRRDSIDIPGITCRAFETDALGRVIAETDEDGHRTAFAFDEVGRLVSVTDARGKQTSYEFDDRGSMVSQTDALERVTRYEQDSAGRRVARVLPMLQRETFAYTVTGAPQCHYDLKVPPGNRLHELERDRKGQHFIAVNDQWRTCFRFVDGDAFDVEVTDYH